MTPHVITSKIKAFSVVTKGHAVSVSGDQVIAHQEPDRQLKLTPAHGVVEGSIRFPRRPKSTDGFEAWSSEFIATPGGHKFAICISVYRNGIVHPFEVWAMGQEQPPAASLICQLLSQVMMTNDRPFIRHYLKALTGALETPFEITLPHSRRTVRADSVGAAIAHVVLEHGKHIGYFSDADFAIPSPMIEAMTSRKEPKSNGLGFIAAGDDISNPSTGDNTPLFIKEAFLTDTGLTLPQSVWFGSRRVPEESEAILKLISLAMRHRDPVWPISFLKTLRKYSVPNQELGFAKVGHDKPVFFGSTWAYVAELILHRYRQLGVINDDNDPVKQASLFAEDSPSETTYVPAKTSAKPICPSCNESAVVMEAGCLTCSACGFSKCS